MREPASEIVGQIVALRRVGSAVGSVAERRRLAQVTRQLRRRLEVGVPKRQAAAVLGVSVQTVDRWIGRGKIPVVRRPGSSRELVETDALLALAAEVTPLREQDEPHALARAVAALDARGGIPRRLRPNQSARELRYEFLHSSPTARMREAIELSHVGAALVAHARARRKSKAGH